MRRIANSLRGDQPMSGTKTKKHCAVQPELILAVPSNTAHPLQKHDYGWAKGVLKHWEPWHLVPWST